jgi:hypothetical protein
MSIIKHAGLASLIPVNAPSPCRFNLTTVTKNRFPSQAAARKWRMLFDDPTEAANFWLGR